MTLTLLDFSHLKDVKYQLTTILDKIPWDSNTKPVIIEDLSTSSKRIAIF